MSSAQNLVDLFQAITQNLEQDRSHLNQLDSHDYDIGDNMAENFQLATQALSRAIGKNPEQADVGMALQQAAQTLSQRGRGATAPIYAQGLAEAAQKFMGKTGFSLQDLLPLLQGLLQGAQQRSQVQPGQGSMLDALLPGIMGYMQSKQAGQSDLQSLLNGLLSARRGANGTALSPNAFGRAMGTDTRGRIDPGAAGAASLLEGLFGGLLQGGLGSQLREQERGRSAPQGQLPGLDQLLGRFFDGGGETPQRRTRGSGKETRM